MGDGGVCQLALEGLERASVFRNAFVGPFPHRLESFGMFGIAGQIDEFVGIVLQIMEELMVVLIDVADVFKIVVPDSFERGNAIPHGEVLVEGFCPPVVRCSVFNKRAEAGSLIAIGDDGVGPVEEGCRQIEIQHGSVADLSLLCLRHAGVCDDEWHVDGLLKVGPFSGEATVTHVVAVVGGVDDDGIVCQPGFFECLHEASDSTVDSTDHAEVGAHVSLVFFVSIPAPEVALTVDGGFEEIGQSVEGRGIVKMRTIHFHVVIHSVDRTRPGEVPDPGAPVFILGVAGVEPHVERERFAFWLLLQKLDSLVDDNLRFMTKRAVGHFLVKGIATDGLEFIEVIRLIVSLGHLGMPLAEVTGAVAFVSKDVRIECLDGISAGEFVISRGAVAATGQSCENRRAAHPADGVADVGIVEPGAAFREPIDVGCLNDGVSVTADGAGGLVVGKEEDDVGRICRGDEGGAEKESGEEKCYGAFHFEFVNRQQVTARRQKSAMEG